MADLNQGTRQRNLRQLSGGAAVPSGNTRSMSSGGPPAPSTDWIQALGGRIGGWCIENGKLTADGGNVKLNSFVPSISLGAATDYITGTGFWVGKNSAVYKLHLGDPAANHLKWDGSTLTVVGTISATAGAIGGWTIGANSISADGGAAVIDSSTPKITLGAASDYLSGAGFFVGKSGGAYKWHIGDPAADYIGWSGSTLVAAGNWITGSAVNFLNIPVLNGATWTNNSPSAGYVAWNSFTLTYQGVSYTITAGNTNHKYVWWNKATSTTVLQSSNTAPNGAVDQFLVCLNSSGTALPALFQNVIYADHIKATQLSAIAADLGSITAGTITGGLIRTAASGARVQLDGTYLAGYGTDGVTKQFYLNASDGKAYAGGGRVVLDSSGVTITSGLLTEEGIKWKSAGTSAQVVILYGDDGQTGYNVGVLQVKGETARPGAHLVLRCIRDGGPSVGITINTNGVFPYIDLDGNVNVNSVDGSSGNLSVDGNTTMTGTLTVGGLSVRPSGDARFHAWVSSNILNVTGDGTGYAVVFGSESYDDGSDYNTGTGIFTAPVTGRYHFDAVVSLIGIVSPMSFAFIQITTTAKVARGNRINATNSFDGGALGLVCSVDLPMNAGDTAYVQIYVFGGAKVVDVEGNATASVSYFDGHLIT